MVFKETMLSYILRFPKKSLVGMADLYDIATHMIRLSYQPFIKRRMTADNFQGDYAVLDS